MYLEGGVPVFIFSGRSMFIGFDIFVVRSE